MVEDVRWHQRLESFQRALINLTSAVMLRQSRALSVLEQQGLIQVFEFTHELAWNVMKDYLQTKFGSNKRHCVARFNAGRFQGGSDF